MSKVETAIEDCAELLDRACAPEKMSVEEAIEFWEGIAAEAEARLDALHEDSKAPESQEA